MNTYSGGASAAANNWFRAMWSVLADLRALPALPVGAARCEPRQAYLFAVLVTLATLEFPLARGTSLSGHPALVILALPIMFSSYLGGWRPGMLATVLACLGTNYYLLPPIHSLAVASCSDRRDLWSIALAGLFISGTSESLHRARRRADANARKRTEAAAMRLASIVEASDDAIIGKDLSGIVESWNPGAERIFGYSASEMIGESILRIIPAERGEEEAAMLKLIARGETIRRFDTQRIGKDGGLLDVSVTITAIRDAAGRIIGASKVAHDITAKKRHAQALRASELRYRRLFETAADGILILDAATGLVVDVNPSLLTLLRLSRAEFLGKAVWKLGFLKDIFAKEEAFAELREKEYLRYENLPLETGDGRRIEVEFVSNVYQVDGSKVIQCSVRDQTEKHKAEAARQESEQRFRTMADSMSQLAWIARADGYLSWYNQRWYEYTGTTPEQMEGWGWQSVHDPAALPEIMEKWTAAIAAGSLFEMELPLRGSDGQFRTFLTRGRPVKDAAGRVIQWFGTNTDIEAMKRAEAEIHLLNTELEERVAKRTAQLAAANEALEAYSSTVERDLRVAEAADRIKSAFLATMSHELRTPLNSILGFTGIVLQGLAGPLTPEQTKQLGMVKGSARHLLTLINDVLDISKIEAGQLNVHRETFDLRAAVERVTASVHPLLAKKGLTLTVDVPPALTGFFSDRRRVEQILLNLLSNAIKFTEYGGVTLTAKIITDAQLSPGAAPRGAVHIEVADTGIGIEPGDLATLFQPFRQIDSGLARLSEGSGLGLAISRRLAILLDGSVIAASEWSKGSTFTLVLPLQKPVESCLPPSS